MDEDLWYRDSYRIPSTRRCGWDYGDPGSYFITICTKGRVPWFGNIQHGFVCLSDIGSIVYEYWNEIPIHFAHVTIDRFVVMPNHVHGIVRINDRAIVETCESHVSTTATIPRPMPGSLGSIIGQFKSFVTKRVRIIDPEFAWQTRFHDNIIRNHRAMVRIRRYITRNPMEWNQEHISNEV